MQAFYQLPAYGNFQDAHLHPPLTAAMLQETAQRLYICASRAEEWPIIMESADYPQFSPFAGIHPSYVGRNSENELRQLRTILERYPCGVGEIGLHKGCGDASHQELLFACQLQLAREFKRALTIHCVGRWGKMIEMLAELPAELPLLFHGYAGSLETARILLSRHRAFFSFGVRELCKPRHHLTIKNLPLSAILLETDYSAGNKEGISRENQLAEAYQLLAKLRGICPIKLCQEVWNNGTIFTSRSTYR